MLFVKLGFIVLIRQSSRARRQRMRQQQRTAANENRPVHVCRKVIGQYAVQPEWLVPRPPGQVFSSGFAKSESMTTRRSRGSDRRQWLRGKTLTSVYIPAISKSNSVGE